MFTPRIFVTWPGTFALKRRVMPSFGWTRTISTFGSTIDPPTSPNSRCGTSLNVIAISVTRRAARFEEGGFEIGRLPLGKEERLFLFNWDDQPATRVVKLPRPVRLRDEWEGTDLGEHRGAFTVELPPHSARLLRATRP